MVAWRRLYCLWYVRRVVNFTVVIAVTLFLCSIFIRGVNYVIVSKQPSLHPRKAKMDNFLNTVNFREYLKREEMKNINQVTNGTSSKTANEICVRKYGRFGNQMFQMAALIGIANQNRMTPFMETNSDLIGTFLLPDMDIQPIGKCDSFKVTHEKRMSAYNRIAFEGPGQHAIAGYFQSWRYFEAVKEKVRRQFTLRQFLVNMAMKTLAKLLKQQKKPISNLTLVALHVRRSDLLNPERVRQGNNVAPILYIRNAMNYFRRSFGNVLFVCGSDDMNWVRSHVTSNDVLYLEGVRADVDFAILSNCDHAVITVGSFGWWLAWLVNGTTVYYKYPYSKNSFLYNSTVMSDYIYSGWIPME